MGIFNCPRNKTDILLIKHDILGISTIAYIGDKRYINDVERRKEWGVWTNVFMNTQHFIYRA
jgi:hypothetical protein